MFQHSTPPEAGFAFSGAVLAGGRSSRMGRDKAFLKIDGETLVHRQARLLRDAGASEVLVSGRRGVDYGLPEARLVFDATPDAGPLAGVAAVLAKATHPWTLVVAVDLPRLSAAFLSKLLTASAGSVGVVPCSSLGHEPLVALYPRILLPLAEAALEKGNLSLQRFVAEAERGGHLRSLVLSSEDEAEFANWNTPQDFLPPRSAESK